MSRKWSIAGISREQWTGLGPDLKTPDAVVLDLLGPLGITDEQMVRVRREKE